MLKDINMYYQINQLHILNKFHLVNLIIMIIKRNPFNLKVTIFIQETQNIFNILHNKLKIQIIARNTIHKI